MTAGHGWIQINCGWRRWWWRSTQGSWLNWRRRTLELWGSAWPFRRNAGDASQLIYCQWLSCAGCESVIMQLLYMVDEHNLLLRIFFLIFHNQVGQIGKLLYSDGNLLQYIIGSTCFYISLNMQCNSRDTLRLVWEQTKHPCSGLLRLVGLLCMAIDVPVPMLIAYNHRIFKHRILHITFNTFSPKWSYPRSVKLFMHLFFFPYIYLYIYNLRQKHRSAT